MCVFFDVIHFKVFIEFATLLVLLFYVFVLLGDIFMCPKKKIIKLHALQKVLLASKVLQQNSGSFPIPKPGMR